ncbi:MAG: Ig-like domain-containing protein [Thermoleophilia bacterium]
MAVPSPASGAETPAVKITAPVPSAQVVSGLVPLAVRAHSASGIRRVEFRIDGKRRWVQTKAPWRFGGPRGRWDTRRYSAGTRRVAVVAVGRDGSRGATIRRVKVVRATARPYVAITSPKANATVRGKVVLSAQATANRGISRVEFRIDGKRRWTARSAPWRFGGASGKWDTAKYPTGKRTITVTAFDKAGRKTVASRKVTIKRSGSTTPATPAPTPPPSTGGGGGSPAFAPYAPPAKALGPATRFVSASGSDSGSCTASSPCRSLNRAYQVAAPGEVVDIAGGNYPHQTFGGGSGKSRANPVYFRPAAGASVSMSNLRFEGTVGVEIRDVHTVGWYVNTGSDGITLRGVRSTGGSFITSASHVSIVGGEVGPVDSVDAVQVKRASASAPNPSDIVFDGVTVHDVTRRADPDVHTDCMQFGAGERVAIRNSVIYNCSTQGVFTREFSGGVIRDWVVENNFFGKANEGYYSLIIHRELSADKKFLVRYNSSIQAWRLESHGLTVIGNVAPMASNACDSAITYRYNVWSAAKCHSTDVAAAPGFLNPGAMDLRLAAGSAAINRGDPSAYPPGDITGTARPLGGRPDAGAHERQ